VVEVAQKSRKLRSSSIAPKQSAIPALREKKLVFMAFHGRTAKKVHTHQTLFLV
jgi:hypothetical protein